MSRYPLGAIALVLATAVAVAAGSFVHEAVERDVHVRAPALSCTVTVRARNSGSKDASSYAFVLEVPSASSAVTDVEALQAKPRIAGVSATSRGGKSFSVRHTGSSNGLERYEVSFEKPVSVGALKTIVLSYTVLHAASPHPFTIEQEGTQWLRIHGNGNFLSPYNSQVVTTTLHLGTSKAEGSDNVAVAGEKAVVGPLRDVKGDAKVPFSVRFEAMYPVISSRTYAREVKISHWGTVSVTESYDFANLGSRLRAGFSRWRHTKTQYFGQSQPRPFATRYTANLPGGLEGLYYRDVLGNVTTSRTRYNAEDTVLELVPRYPLYGGWHYDFHYGYELPLSRVVSVARSDRTKHYAQIPLRPGITDFWLENAAISVILPEGATDIEVELPEGAVATVKHSKTKSYLDTDGRPTVTVTFDAVDASKASGSVVVSYRFSAMSMLAEPAMLVGTVLCLFFVLIAGSRFSPSLSGGASMRSAADKAKLETLHELLQERDAVYEATQEKFETAVTAGQNDKAKDISRDGLAALAELDSRIAAASQGLSPYAQTRAEAVEASEKTRRAAFSELLGAIRSNGVLTDEQSAELREFGAADAAVQENVDDLLES